MKGRVSSCRACEWPGHHLIDLESHVTNCVVAERLRHRLPAVGKVKFVLSYLVNLAL